MQVFNYGGMAADAINQFGDSLSDAMVMRQERKDGQQQQDALKQAAQLYSTGTPDEIAQFSIQNPKAGEILSNQLAFKNDATRKNMMDSMQQILLDPSQTESVLTNRIKMIQEQGGDPSQTMAELEQFRANPEGYEQKVERAYAVMDPKGYTAYRQAMPQQPKQISPYEQAKLEGEEKDRELRRQEIELRRLESEQKRAKTSQEQEAKTQQIEQKRKEVDEAKAQDKTRIDNGINTANQNKQVIDDLLNNDDYMSSLTGYTGRIPAVTTTGVEAEAYLDNIKNSMTIDNLGVMSGPLTDKDIQIIASASSRLRSGMSETALNKELNTIKKAYDRVINNYQKEANRKGYKPEDDSKDSSKVVFSSSKYGDVTEADIQTTMQKHNMTREQVMSRLGM